MPGIVKVRVVAARDLPVMDRSSESTDAFVEVKFHDDTFKTNVCRKTLCPSWNADFRFEAEDAEIQNEVLEIKVYDHDSYSANDAIGKVYIDLSPLAVADGPNVLQGWHPIYDTLRGIRGEINIVVKLQIFGNENKFRDTSVGVQIFALSEFPSGYRTAKIHSFVEELVVSTDPEYQWVDNFRTSRASNDARVRLLYGLSGSLKRKLGLKALELGGNAIIGYNQNFDIEGEYGLVARGIGTVVTLIALENGQEHDIVSNGAPTTFLTGPTSPLTDSITMTSSIPNTSDQAPGTAQPVRFFSSHHTQKDVSLFTLTNWPRGVVQTIGGIVTARSVKLLNKIKEPDEPETRDVWWIELREEISSHARALGCNMVIGYSEQTSICDELCVLSATGTAARLKFATGDYAETEQNIDDDSSDNLNTPQTPPAFHRSNIKPDENSLGIPTPNKLNSDRSAVSGSKTSDGIPDFLGLNDPRAYIAPAGSDCWGSFCHIAFRRKQSPFTKNLKKCKACKRKYVPQLLLSSVDMPYGCQITDNPVSIEARVCRVKKKLQGEYNAIAVSEALPFLEYDIHRQLLNKLKLMARNAVFSLSIQVSVGETLIAAVASGTAVFLKCLPPLPPIQITRSLDVVDEEDKNLVAIQTKIMDLCAQNRQARKDAMEDSDSSGDDDGQTSSSDEDRFEEETDFGGHSSVLEIDDEEDEDSMAILMDPDLIFGASTHFTTSENIYGIPDNMEPYNIQMITSMHRITLNTNSHLNVDFATFFNSIRQGLCFKLRRFDPCWVTNLKYEIQMSPEDDDRAQVMVSAMVIGLKEKVTNPIEIGLKEKNSSRELVFDMSDNRNADSTRSGIDVEMTTMNYIPRARVTRFLSHVEIFLIKENSVREMESMNQFIHIFVTEAYAVALAHVRSLGGNSLFALKLRIIDSNTSQGYVLVMLSGDACIKEPIT